MAVDQACALELLVDHLLQEASDEFERATQETIQHQLRYGEEEHKLSRFAAPKTKEDVEMAIATRVPKKTQTDAKYCVELWKKWSIDRNSIVEEEKVPVNIEAIDIEQLQYWLSHFVLEVRKKDGSEYPPNTIHHLCCGLLHHIRQCGHPDIDIFKDISFSKFTFWIQR